MKKNRRQQVRRGSPELPFPKCVYCQQRDGRQAEHIVAQAFFDRPRPALPKVPACRECNQLRGDGGIRNMSDDEAYVRDRSCMMRGVEQHHDARNLLTSKVLRNFERPESERERRNLVESMRPTMVRLGPDQYLSGVWSFGFEMDRFERVMRKVVRGLHAFHHGSPMPLHFGCEAVRIMDHDMFRHCLGSLQKFGPSPTYSIGERQAIWYQYGPRDVSQLGSNWLIVVYHVLAFYVHAGPEGSCRWGQSAVQDAGPDAD